MNRCTWVKNDPLEIAYHDDEWGVPITDDQKLFEFLILEGAQAGLSWSTVLKKRENYRQAFANFDPERVAQFNEQKQQELKQNSGIIRNKLKIASAVTNARLFLDMQAEYGSFASYIWQFVGNKPIQNHWENLEQVPATTPQSEAMSKELKKRGFKFVGSTICYAFMQATGMVNDHTTDCFCYEKIKAMKSEINVGH
ncbi:DNA-3-methyladenine glycosylase I [Waterburya agarophytonicola K14]|uniref:DNA-3-methyladenine glycosylase I n=1 Tax=Waterburya agarophytonicola KI4 TaxID=2874699 RepID=A0A964FG13_9CYAN|nr:DNA-3-methyladenine glycosylase I [Waterburya agarophytonicola]MCC0178450.1 DNA-3-methyladenine glycosylase I [Waterburya agarophytonicola KI4]